MNRKILITKSGYKDLKNELEDLIRNKRREVAERLKEAKDFGDLTENSEYEDAKNEQAFIEGRILQINEILSKAEIVSERHNTKSVKIGSFVTLKNINSNEVVKYKLVSSIESDPLNNKISYESPLGTSIINMKVGSTVKVEVPAGVIKYEILDID
ncbi:MAG: transcription elongation factor GreA [Actinobacteria bacterium]|nr:transcription elongation factor GreA [Actinomycetota bacterium]